MVIFRDQLNFNSQTNNNLLFIIKNILDINYF